MKFTYHIVPLCMLSSPRSLQDAFKFFSFSSLWVSYGGKCESNCCSFLEGGVCVQHVATEADPQGSAH